MIYNIHLHQNNKLDFRDKTHHYTSTPILLSARSILFPVVIQDLCLLLGFGCYFYTVHNLEKYNIKFTVPILKVIRKGYIITAYQLYHNQIYLVFLLT